jgi:hypothetical protein
LLLVAEPFQHVGRWRMVSRGAQPHAVARNCKDCALLFEMFYQFRNFHALTPANSVFQFFKA